MEKKGWGNENCPAVSRQGCDSIVINVAMYNAAAYNGLQVYKKFLCGGNTYVLYMNYNGMNIHGVTTLSAVNTWNTL